MLHTKIIFIKIKNLFLPLTILIFTFFLIVFSKDNLTAAKKGLVLWVNSVIPSLFPFFIATELLSYTNIINLLGKFLNKIMRPVFNVPGEGAFALVMGIISGYPIGAKIVSELKNNGICTDVECERLISFTNNSGPLFIIGTVGLSLFYSQEIGIKLLIVHILSCVLVGFLFRFWKHDNSSKKKSHFYLNQSSNNKKTYNREIHFNNLGDILSVSIQSAIKSILMIGGFIVLFSVIVSMLKSSNILTIIASFFSPILDIFNIPIEYNNSIIIGLIEVTNGLKLVAFSNSNTSIIISSFLLGFGGFSVLFQILSITSKAKISIKPYIIGKLLQAIFSAIIMYIIL